MFRDVTGEVIAKYVIKQWSETGTLKCADGDVFRARQCLTNPYALCTYVPPGSFGSIWSIFEAAVVL